MGDDIVEQLQLDALLRFSRLLTSDRGLAEDLVQDVVLRLVENAQGMAGVANVDGYARKMVLNRYLSWRRKWARIQPRAALPEVFHDPMDVVDLRDELRVTLTRLPDRQRAALILRFYLDLPDDQIADELGCTVTTVRSHISRGLARLRITYTQEIRQLDGSPPNDACTNNRRSAVSDGGRRPRRLHF